MIEEPTEFMSNGMWKVREIMKICNFCQLFAIQQRELLHPWFPIEDVDKQREQQDQDTGEHKESQNTTNTAQARHLGRCPHSGACRPGPIRPLSGMEEEELGDVTMHHHHYTSYGTKEVRARNGYRATICDHP